MYPDCALLKAVYSERCRVCFTFSGDELQITELIMSFFCNMRHDCYCPSASSCSPAARLTYFSSKNVTRVFVFDGCFKVNPVAHCYSLIHQVTHFSLSGFRLWTVEIIWVFYLVPLLQEHFSFSVTTFRQRV